MNALNKNTFILGLKH